MQKALGLPGLALLATRKPGTDVWGWDFSPKNISDVSFASCCCSVQWEEENVAGMQGGGRRNPAAFCLFLEMTQQSFEFVSSG